VKTDRRPFVGSSTEHTKPCGSELARESGVSFNIHAG
jgi:hypothetical protein